MARRDACDLRAAATAAAAAAEAVNVDRLHRWVQPFLLPRLPANPSGRLVSAASPQISVSGAGLMALVLAPAFIIIIRLCVYYRACEKPLCSA
ncbi:hypothetical protein PAMP_003511 [Pampus punctatissimus]